MWLFLMVASWIQLPATIIEELIRKRHLNPEGFMNISELINYWGYPSEEYQILTADGYYLQANRIPYGMHSPGKTEHRPAVLLVHGFVADGRSWIANLPSNSLGFFLADAGYDVWILNCRGSTWSRRHQNLSIDQELFWDFSFHEIGIYDVPATINFILQKSQQDAIYYIAHSQGSAAGFIAFSTMPQLAQKVKLFLSFAPAYTLVDTKGFFGLLLSLSTALKTVVWGKKEFCLCSNRFKYLGVNTCSYPGLDRLCLKIFFTVTGVNDNNLNVSRADVYAGILPDFSSVKTETHGSQVFKSNQFKQFDYGSNNKEFYNMTTPPFYKIEDMNVPTAVWYGGNDILTSKKDIELLLPRFSHLVFQKYVPYWEHLECIWGLDAPELIYPDMLFLMQKYK